MRRQSSEPRSKLDACSCSGREARENVRARVAVGFGFTPDWSRKWRVFFKPMTKRGNVILNQTRITFDSQVKTALRDEEGLVSEDLKLCLGVG